MGFLDSKKIWMWNQSNKTGKKKTIENDFQTSLQNFQCQEKNIITVKLGKWINKNS